MAVGSVIALDEILPAFGRLTEALIDTSSVLYTQKAGYFTVLGETIQLYSIPEVISEIKTAVAGIRVIHHPGTSSLSTDRKLILCALEKRMALISEDKQILVTMRRAEAPYYNALMMLNFLLYAQKIDDDGYRHYLNALRGIARYSETVWKFGRQIHAAVKSKIDSGPPL